MRLVRIGAAAATGSPSSRRKAIEHIQRNPCLPVLWLELNGLLKEEFPATLRQLVLSDDLTRNGVILCIQDELQNCMADDLQQASDMTAERMRGSAAEPGPVVAFERLSGIADGWGLEDLDTFTVLRRPALA